MSYPLGMENAILRRLLSQTTEAYEEQLAELHAEKEFHQITLESIVDGVITTNEEGLIHSLNPVAEELTGWPIREALAKPLSQIFELLDSHGAPIGLSTDQPGQQQKGEATLVQRDGRRFSVEYSASPLHDRMANRIGMVIVFQDVTERRLMQLQLAHEATHDPLTGVLNRRAFDQRLREALRLVRSDQKFGLCYVDLDRFKLVNDTCGHFAGDELLRQITALIQQRVGAAGSLGRLGGDEFAALIPDADGATLSNIAQSVFDAIREYRFSWGERTFDITASMGVVPITGDFDTVDQVLAAADHCCYLSKERGRNRIQLYRPTDEEIRRRHGQMDWVGRIEGILDAGGFTLHAQRIHSLGDEPDVDLFEVLIRIEDGHGTFLPGEVINAAESYGLMPKIDRWVIRNALDTLAASSRSRPSLCSLNLSPLSLADPELSLMIEAILDEHSISGERICFEISETAAMTNLSEARELVDRLRRRGCRFALDDFGAGMSSLAHLKELRFDFVKIHQTFIADLASDAQDRAMVEAIHQLSHILGMRTVAESVSSIEIRRILAEIGVDYGQGFALSEPVPLGTLLQS